MLAYWHVFITNPFTHGAVTGVVAAAAADYAAFRSWTSWHDAVTYSWGVASWRWFQGAVAGIVGAAGLWVIGG